ncbi:Panacea domain-containing protein [Actinokineospora sp.]|uniref:Panacea domain-containing protein n=1 Tax=Actinokineospora sp. TaxID=1872133 RepID=UPI0040381E42
MGWSRATPRPCGSSLSGAGRRACGASVGRGRLHSVPQGSDDGDEAAEARLLQAWHLVWDEEPLFEERIEAWANGPVVPELYRQHRGRLRLDSDERLGGDPAALRAGERETVEAVLAAYGDKQANWLSELTHREAPWRNARQREQRREGDRGSSVIRHDDMFEYYDGLTSAGAEEV